MVPAATIHVLSIVIGVPLMIVALVATAWLND